MDYRFTLNLPNTNFSMKANLSKNEPDILKFWNYVNMYKNRFRGQKKSFILNDGPPYANGDIHMGHALNKILKDIICKFKTFNGHFVNFIPGWDCHGLPIELNVEKTISSKFEIYSKDKIRELCGVYANKQINLQKKSFIRLGVIANWDKCYRTMDNLFELSIINCFKTMLEKKYIYSGYRPVYWCFKCLSALAEAEIEYHLKQSDSIYVFFEISDKAFCKRFLLKFDLLKIGFLIWTTTPWTIPFNEGVALIPDGNYILVKFNRVGYIFSKDLFSDLSEKFDFNSESILFTFNSFDFKNLFLFHPFYDKLIKVVFSNHVTCDSGTGCVHIAPAHGYDDYKVSIEYKLPLVSCVDSNGFFNKNVLFFSNKHIDVVNVDVISLLRSKGHLFFHEKINHRYPHCWRHKTSLIFRTTRQWFINIDRNGLRNNVLNAVSKYITWIPISGRDKMESMLSERIDWCISRQRYWGVPLMLFVNKFDGSIHPKMLSIFERLFVYVKKYGVSFWYKNDIFDMLSIDADIYYKVTDVLDVWFDSSAVYKYFFDTYGFKLPFDLCIEGSDQYRGWFQVSLINSMSNYGVVPYKTVITHGFVLDEFGRKMSKSLNNVVLPDDIVKTYGADILRLWVSSVNYIFDINISNEVLNRISDAYRKIRNTFKFLFSNLYDFEFDFNLCNNISFLEIDVWIFNRFKLIKQSVLNYYNSYKFHNVYRIIYDFCVNDLGGRYLDIIKDRLYVNHASSDLRRSAQVLLFYLVYNLIKLVSPILSFTAEEAWHFLPFKDTKSVFFSQFDIDCFYYDRFGFFDVYDHIFWNKLFDLKFDVNKVIEGFRDKHVVGSLLSLSLNIYCDVYWYNLLYKVRNELHSFLLVSSVKILFLPKTLHGLFLLDMSGIYISLEKTMYSKCERCWHRLVDKLYSNLSVCDRCLSNLYYETEKRSFV